MKKQMLVAIAVTVMFSSFSGCKKKSTMPEEVVDTTDTPVETVEEFIEETLPEYDTTQFVESNLEAEFQALVEKKLQTVYFDYNSHALRAESQEVLQVAAEFLNSDKARTRRIKITGHTDERGSTEYNMALGERRAEAVRDFIEQLGVNSARIEITSAGREIPETRGCDTDLCHDRNRRAEFKVIN